MSLLINIGVAVQLILMCIIPASDSYISIAVISIFSIISLISLYYIFMYYYLLPDFKQNILVYLTRLLTIFHGFQIVYNLPIEIVLHCFKKQLIFLLKDHLEILVIVRQRFNPGVLWMAAIVEIIALKTLLKFAPVFYLGMNTTKIKFISLLLPILVFVLQIVFTKTYNAGLCSFIEYYTIDIPDIDQIANSNRKRNSIMIWIFVLAFILLALELYNCVLHEKIKSSVSALSKVFPEVVTRNDIETGTPDDTERRHDEETAGNNQTEEVDNTQIQRVNSNQVSNIGISIPNIDNYVNESTEPENNPDEETNEVNSDIKEDKEPKVIRNDLNSTAAPIVKHKMKIPISYGFVLIMAILVCFNVFILFLNLETENSKVISMISLTLFKIALVNAPFWWILSHTHAKEFAVNRLRQHLVNWF